MNKTINDLIEKHIIPDDINLNESTKQFVNNNERSKQICKNLDALIAICESKKNDNTNQVISTAKKLGMQYLKNNSNNVIAALCVLTIASVTKDSALLNLALKISQSGGSKENGDS